METKRILALAEQRTATADQKTKAKETATESFVVVCLLENADPKRFLSLFNDLRKDMIKNQDNFLRNDLEAFDMLNRWKPTNRMVTDRYRPNTRVGHMYAQSERNPFRVLRLCPGMMAVLDRSNVIAATHGDIQVQIVQKTNRDKQGEVCYKFQ